jgi:plasmid stability protein
MPNILIPDIKDTVLTRLRQRAVANGRSPEEEAKAILRDVLQAPAADAWAEVNALRERLAATGRSFGDSAEQLREDRER